MSLGIVAGLAYIVHQVRRPPTRAVIEATRVHEGWTTHLIRVGAWSEQERRFLGSTRFEFEIIGPDGAIHRGETHTDDEARASELMNRKLAELEEDRDHGA